MTIQEMTKVITKCRTGLNDGSDESKAILETIEKCKKAKEFFDKDTEENKKNYDGEI